MVITPHVLAGLVIATNVERLRFRNGWSSKRMILVSMVCVISFASHFVLDKIPHFDYLIYPDPTVHWYKIFIDSSLAAIIFLIIFYKHIGPLLGLLSQRMGTFGNSDAKIKLRFLPLFLTMISGCFAALLPDIIMLISASDKTPLLQKFRHINQSLHSGVIIDPVSGIFIQIFASGFLIYWLFYSAKRLELEGTFEEAEAWLMEVKQ